MGEKAFDEENQLSTSFPELKGSEEEEDVCFFQSQVS